MKDGTYIVQLHEDGFPILSEPLVMSNGYWVSTEGISVHGKLTRLGLSAALDLMDLYPGAVVGVWESEGITYIDNSVLIKERDKALAVAEACGQLAIYDNSKGEVVEL